MSGDADDERLEELRKQRMQELQEQQGGQEAQEAQEAQQQAAEQQKQALLRQALTDDARKRLNTIRMSKPEFAEQVERQVIALARSGRLSGQLDDSQMKALLRELKPDEKSFNIRRR